MSNCRLTQPQGNKAAQNDAPAGPLPKTVCPEPQLSRSSLSAEEGLWTASGNPSGFKSKATRSCWQPDWLMHLRDIAVFTPGKLQLVSMIYNWKWGVQFSAAQSVSQLAVISCVPPTGSSGNSAFEVTRTRPSSSPAPELNRGVGMCCLSPR